MNTKLPLFHGSLTALITPMNTNGEIDFVTLKSLVEYHINSGTHGIVVMGTTGEAATMTDDEYLNVIKKVVEYVAKRIPVIAGAGKNSTRAAIETTRKLENVGIDACLTVTPYYNKPTQEGMYQHFRAIAESTKLPQILYNVPGRTGVDLLPETVGRLAKIDNIIGIKEATGDVNRVQQIKAVAGEDFIVLSGDDATGLESIKNGAQGVISVTNNIAAAEMAQMCELALSGAIDEADKINQKLMPLHVNLFVESNPIPVKWAAYEIGLIASPTLRLPLTSLSEKGQHIMKNALSESGVRGIHKASGVLGKLRRFFKKFSGGNA